MLAPSSLAVDRHTFSDQRLLGVNNLKKKKFISVMTGGTTRSLVLVRSRIAFSLAGSGPVGAAVDEVEPPPTCESADEDEEPSADSSSSAVGAFSSLGPTPFS